jgi:hypothetical protein
MDNNLFNFILGVVSSIVATILGKVAIYSKRQITFNSIKKALFLSNDGKVQIYFGGHTQQNKDIMIHNEAIYAIQKLQPVF